LVKYVKYHIEFIIPHRILTANEKIEIQSCHIITDLYI